MRRGGQLTEWYRFLDAGSDDEAASVARRHMARLEDVYDTLNGEGRALASSPDGEVEEMLRVARIAVAEAIDVFDDLSARFRSGERDAS